MFWPSPSHPRKNEDRNDIINQFRTGDPTLCPVKAWAAIIKRIRSYMTSSAQTTVNTYLQGKSMVQITSANVRVALRRAVVAIGQDKLGFGPNEVGTHSIRSGAAMAMYLAKV